MITVISLNLINLKFSLICYTDSEFQCFTNFRLLIKLNNCVVYRWLNHNKNIFFMGWKRQIIFTVLAHVSMSLRSLQMVTTIHKSTDGHNYPCLHLFIFFMFLSLSTPHSVSTSLKVGSWIFLVNLDWLGKYLHLEITSWLFSPQISLIGDLTIFKTNFLILFWLICGGFCVM